MGLFSNLFKSNGQPQATFNNPEPEQQRIAAPDIPERLFIETPEPQKEKTELPKEEIRQDNIQTLYDFLSKDYHNMGYDDALKNPDTSSRDANINSILSDFSVLIRRVKTFYEDTLLELDFLIESRSRLGMVDIVDELKMKRNKAKDHYDKSLQIEQEALNKLGSSQRVIISYQRGFNDGMAAIAHHEIGKRQF